VGVLLMFFACAYQSTCERELARAQNVAPGERFVELTRRLATMPTTVPVCAEVVLDEGEEYDDLR
jgi:hypothetical protein